MADDEKVVKGIPVEEIQTSPQEREVITRMVVQRIDLGNRIRDLEATKKELDGRIGDRFKALGLHTVTHQMGNVSLVESKGRETLNKDLLKVNLLGVGLDAGTVSDVLLKSVKVGEGFAYVKVTPVK